MSPDSREQFRYRIIPNRREAVRLAVIGGEYQDEDGPPWTECRMINKALALAEWHRKIFITIEARCNVIALMRIESPGSSYWRPEGPLRGGLR